MDLSSLVSKMSRVTVEIFAAGDGVNRVVGRVKNDEEEKEGSEEEHVKPGKFLVMKQESDFPFKYRYSIVAWPATAEA